jgi:hypothetical protein
MNDNITCQQVLKARFVPGASIFHSEVRSSTFSRIGNYNRSAIILTVGGGRARPDASEELQAAEDQVRSARLWAWRRGR